MDTDWRTALASLIDHTILKPDATAADVANVVTEAQELATYSVCVSPAMLPLDAGPTPVAVVCGFPSGKHAPEIKAAEAALAIANGAAEIDMVIDLGLVHEGRFDAVQDEIAQVRAAVPSPRVLKVIIESAALNDDEIVACCHAAAQAGADFVKTSTGFHPAGGASVHAVRLMRLTVGSALGVKASGGVRTALQALEMVAAGANRLGMSSTVAALAEEITPTDAQLRVLMEASPCPPRAHGA